MNCSLSGNPARVTCTTDLQRTFCLRPVGVCPSLPLELQSSVCSYGSPVRDVCYAAGCVLPLAREIGLPTVLDCRAKRLLPGPDGLAPLSPSPRFATRRPSRTNPPLCGMFALRRCVLSTPELWTRCALAVRCGALGTCCALAELRLISPEDGFPPWLLILRCSYGETAPEVASHRGLNEVLSVPHRQWKSPL